MKILDPQSANYLVGRAEKLPHFMVRLPGKTGSEHNENHVISIDRADIIGSWGEAGHAKKL